MRGITNVPKKANGVNAHAATHYAGGGDPLDLAKLGAIPTSEKGKAGGTATLGEDGKVPSGQLPEMNYAAANHGHTFENITGVLPVEKGGTGANSLDALASALGTSKVVAGSYTGDGNEIQTISLGFTPKVVFVMKASENGKDGVANYNNDGTNYYVTCCFASIGYPYAIAAGTNPVLAVCENGFNVHCKTHTYSNSYHHNAQTNKSQWIYNYIAIG